MNFFRSRKVGMIGSFGFLGRESDEFILNHEGDKNDARVISLKSNLTIKVQNERDNWLINFIETIKTYDRKTTIDVIRCIVKLINNSTLMNTLIFDRFLEMCDSRRDTGCLGYFGNVRTGVNMARSMWLFKHKFHDDGTLSRYNARLVANGRSRQQDVNFNETFSPVTKSATICTVLSLALLGFVDARFPNHVCRLLRSLYGLKQAPRAWVQRFAGYATRAGFYHNRYDSSLFICRRGSHVAYLLIYVDDIILTASSPILLQQIIDTLYNKFDMIDLGALSYFLGIYANRNFTGLFLSQKKYALQLLERAHMVHCNSSRTPVDTESKLGLNGVPVQDPTLYRSLAGELQYLTFTRPDLSYAVQQVCLYMHDLREPYFAALKRILRYVRGTVDFAKRQHALSRSSAEAEYRGVANIIAETAWLHNLLCDLHSPLSTATLVYYDNVSAVYMSANPVQHQRKKHIEIDIHFVRDMVIAGQVRVLHVPSRYQYADIFTKGLPSALFEEF
nr:ribonuclease H-like domain-containing protein [Tanacetum cinerariifolium]